MMALGIIPKNLHQMKVVMLKSHSNVDSAIKHSVAKNIQMNMRGFILVKTFLHAILVTKYLQQHGN